MRNQEQEQVLLSRSEIEARLEMFVQRCKQEFQKGEVVGILFHGSMETCEHTAESDCDLTIIFAEKDPANLKKLKEIVCGEENLAIIRNLRPLFLTEMPRKADFYSQNTNGSFFAWHMRTAQLLFGENPFDEMIGPSPYQLAVSLWQKI